MQRILLLLVEDNPADIRLVKEMLDEIGASEVQLRSVGSVSEAGAKLTAEPFDAVLLDLTLPDGRGLETLEKIRGSAADRPVIVLTGLGDDRVALRAVQDGAQDYLVKGQFDGRTLLKSVRYAIERHRAEIVERERRSLESALGAMDQLLAVLGHELRTPLASLRLLSEYMLKHEAKIPSEYGRYLHSINGEVVRMTDLVNNLLEAARLDSGVSQWQWSDVDAHKVCADALELLHPLLDGTRVTLGMNIDPPDLHFSGDPAAIRRLLVNLGSNAIKYTKQGRIDFSCRRIDRSGEPWIEIAVKDTGRGIPDGVARRLGTAFAVNAGVTGSSDTGGTGLGLAICKGIVAVHGGWLSVASEVGKGSTFTATLRADLTGPEPLPPDLKIIREAAT
jgi:signal transduction histidine kinase